MGPSAHRQGQDQICDENEDSDQGEDGADDVHADAAIHLEEAGGGER